MAFRHAPCRVGLALTFTLWAPGSWIGAVAGDEVDTEVMKVAAERHRANRERIATWEGRVSVTTSRQGTAHDGTLRATGRFAWDVVSGNKRWNWEGDPDSPPSDLDERHNNGGMLKEGAYYRLYRKDPSHAVTVMVGTADEARDIMGGWWLPVFNPEMWIDYYGAKLDEFLLVMRRDWDKAKSHAELDYSLRRKDTLVLLETRMKPKMRVHLVQTEQVDLAQGANLVRFYSEGDGGLRDWRWQWEEANGVWVPKQIDILEKKKPNTIETRSYVITENRVNEPLPPDAFTVEAMGARPGDSVLDKRTGARYRIPLPEPAAPRAYHPWPLWAIAVVLTPALVLVLFLVLRRRRMNRAS